VQHIEQADVVIAIPQTSRSRRTSDAHADSVRLPFPCETIAAFFVAAFSAFALVDTKSGVPPHARAIVNAHDIGNRPRQRRAILAFVLLLACPAIPDRNTSPVLA
jgi:hypothetical protein